MKFPCLPLTLFFLLLPFLTQAQTAESLIARHVETIGGKARLDSLKNFGFLAEVDGKKSIGYRRRGNLSRSEIRNPNQNFYVCTCFDGESEWAYVSTAKEPFRPSDRNPNAQLFKKAGVPFVSALIDPAQNGYVTTYLGVKEVEGTKCHEVKLLNPETNLEYRCYLDAQTFLLRKTIRSRPMPELVNAPGGQTLNLADGASETVYDNYRAFGGILFPMRETSTFITANSVQNVTVINFKTYKLNLSLDPAIFKCLPGVEVPNLE